MINYNFTHLFQIFMLRLFKICIIYKEERIIKLENKQDKKWKIYQKYIIDICVVRALCIFLKHSMHGYTYIDTSITRRHS